MREIKFRGKRVDNKEWVEGGFGILGEDTDLEKSVIIVSTLDTNSYIDRFYFTDVEVIPESIGQFTGLKDKNGVEIYEGDIVIIGATSSVIKYFPKYGMFGLTGKSAYKKFDESEPMGSGGSSTRYKPYVLSEHYQRRIEVVGNIHDKHKQKQALIDMMRGDEELGLYDDNPKNHGYER